MATPARYTRWPGRHRRGAGAGLRQRRQHHPAVGSGRAHPTARPARPHRRGVRGRVAWGALGTRAAAPGSGAAESPTKTHQDVSPLKTQGCGALVLASAGADGTVRMWDPVARAQLRVLRGHAGEVFALAWGVLGGMPVLASAGADDAIRLWDPTNGAPLRALHGHTRTVWSVAWGALGSCAAAPGSGTAASPAKTHQDVSPLQTPRLRSASARLGRRRRRHPVVGPDQRHPATRAPRPYRRGLCDRVGRPPLGAGARLGQRRRHRTVVGPPPTAPRCACSTAIPAR